jgi:hypothetical protein
LLGGRRVEDVSVSVAGDERSRVVGGSLDVQANLDGQLSRKRHQLEVADAQRTHLHVERAGADAGFRLVHFEQRQIGVQTRQLFHDLDVCQIRLDLGAILGIEPRQVITAQASFVQVPLGVCRGEVRVQSLLDQQRKKCLEVDVGALQGSHQPAPFGFDGIDPPLEIRGPWERDDLLFHRQLAVPSCLDASYSVQHPSAQEVSQRLCVGRAIDLLVTHGVDVAAAALNEKGHGTVAQRFLDQG